MKVVFLTSLFPNEEFPNQGVFNLSRVKSLIEHSHEVIVISPIGLTPKENNLFPSPKFRKILKDFNATRKIKSDTYFDNIKVYHPKWFWLPRRYFWKYETQLLKFFCGRKVKRIFQNFKPDIVITSWFHPYGTYSTYLEKYFPGKIYSISEGSDLLIMPFKYKGWKSIEFAFNSSTSKLILVSKNQKKFVETELNLKDGYVIENGFNTKNFFYNENLNRKERGTIEIISVGNLYWVKGFDLLLKAMLRLSSNFKLTIIGSGDKKDDYLEFIISNNLKNRVRLVGSVNNQEIISYFEKSDIYCQPSRSEGFPSSPLEAMGCGLPVILSNVGGMPDMIIDNFNGVLFQNENVDDLVSKIIDVSKKKWEHQEIANWAKNNYSWNKWCEKILTNQDYLK